MPIQLTKFSHGGGCGCKIAPSMLRELLRKSESPFYPDLLVGNESSDDAAVYRINSKQAIVATTDFFMPIVDDAFDFGRIAATNAISDIYAMGANPIMALAIVGMPIDKLPVETMQEILAGGETICRQANIPIAGGHSIDSPEPIYGLVVIGLIDPEKTKRNDKAEAGDSLILGKGLGVGILSAALKKEMLSEKGYSQMLQSTTKLNTPGPILAEISGVHALTDVTGFGLLGHLLEICRGSSLGADLFFHDIPVLEEAAVLAQKNIGPGAIKRNWDSYGFDVQLPECMPPWKRDILCDPQTSGGLLVSCSALAEEKVLHVFKESGFDFAAKIGFLNAGRPVVNVIDGSGKSQCDKVPLGEKLSV